MAIITSVPTSGDAWHEWRAGGLGSSDISVLMNTNPWKKIEELWLDKQGLGKPQKDNWAMQKGRTNEPFARDMYNDKYGTNCEPCNFEYDGWNIMRGSSDGFCLNSSTLIEIKVPGAADIAKAKLGLVPEKYHAQCQHLMLTSGVDKLDYVTLDTTLPIWDIYVVRLKTNVKYQRELIRRARWFWHKIENKIPLTLRKARCIKF